MRPSARRRCSRRSTAGVTLFDTAEVYGPFTNEELLGRVLGGSRRDRVVLATKFGFDMSQPAGTGWGLDSRPEHIREVVEQSLRRLQTDRIDLLYQHRVDPKVPIEDVVGAMAELVRRAKCVTWGCRRPAPRPCGGPTPCIRSAPCSPNIPCSNAGLSRTVLPACRELGIGLVPYSPLGRGFLAGQRTRAEDFPEGDSGAASRGCRAAISTPTSSWSKNWKRWPSRARATPARSRWPGCWPRARTSSRSSAPPAAPACAKTWRATAVQLAACDQFLLDQVFAPGNTAGERYLPSAMATLDRDP